MKTIKNYLVFILLALFSAVQAGCEREDVMTLGDLSFENKSTDEEIMVDGDNGFSRVNSLPAAIEENGSGTYVLRRGETYYFQGRFQCRSDVIIKAEPGTGDLPRIQPICDAQGATYRSLFEFFGNAYFENVYILGKDAATGNPIQRTLLMCKAGSTLELNGCYVEGGTSSVIRIEEERPNCNVLIHNSLLRNVSDKSSSDNGRLIDTRSNNMESVIIRNSYCYNNTGQIIRHAGGYSKYFELSGNTFWNQAHVQNMDCPYEGLIENNIFANYAWKPASNATAAMWDFNIAPIPPEMQGTMCITVRNNNFFTTDELEACYASGILAGTYRRSELTNPTGQTLMDDGRFVYENNISEKLAFDYAPPLPLDWIKTFINQGKSAAESTDYSFDVDEDGIEGIKIDQMFKFTYPSNTLSATASTTGGPLGAQWYQ